MLSDEGEIRQVDSEMFSKKDGTGFPAEFTGTSIRENGELVGVVVTFRDITDRRRAEQELASFAKRLERSNGELQHFASVAAHDLQEPLRKVRAFGDRLATKCADSLSEIGLDYLDRMQNAAMRMEVLIQDLLTYSRVTSKARPFTPIDLAEVTTDVLSDLEVRIQTLDGRVETGELPVIDADPMQMRQLMQNLIGNALKFHKPDEPPIVKIESQFVGSQNGKVGAVSQAEQLCQITVEDNGIGFEEKYLDRIFAIFQRLHGRSDYDGTGVGLAVCSKIVERHGGSITATSEPKHGATFIVTLPVAQENGKEDAE